MKVYNYIRVMYLLTTTFLLQFPCLVQAQDVPVKPEIFRDCNVLVIETEGNPEVAYNALLDVLEESGYVIARENAARMSVSTEYKPYKFAGNAVMNITGRVKDGYIYLTGLCEVSGIGFGGGVLKEQVQHKNTPGDARRNAFREMEAVAKKLGKVWYGYQK